MKVLFMTFMLLIGVSCKLLAADSTLEKTIVILNDDTKIVGYIIEEKANEYLWIEKEDGQKVKILVSFIKSKETIKPDVIKIDKEVSINKSLKRNVLTYKNPTKAALLDIIPFIGIGHIYTGKWGRALLFDAGFSICVIWGYAASMSADPGKNGSGKGHPEYPLIGAIGIHVWKIFDAAHCARKNNKLLETDKTSISPRYDVIFGYDDTSKGTNLGVSISF